MLKSFDWVKATAEKRAIPMTDLDCILFEVFNSEREEQ